ncbi:Murein tripeptide amidase MpaA [Andreprevotia lacus DSM 23236]|jgi:murein tripeptide amidase MpaA|uniref:Murein tripeptide amidase MpaA n=1 Tax=Andreprevotia lacus DSM 23236 TaxID=1121001 RepID=A0A1W1XTN7_9NEIS|nr:M14-type cytosolic carboxypeptidase [Andreprevotia lacus]SMC27329.1 Murein tripeptide amidase MpaA [Andreprevotia lacus DSM 23236]
MPTISSVFDSGAIEVIDASDIGNVRLRLRADNASDFAQWFHFRLSGAKDRDAVLHFENAGQSAYPGGWHDYNAVASYDREHWFRVPGEFDGQTYTIRHTPEHDAVWYAYFEPYSWERHQQLIGGALELSPWVQLLPLGQTLDGRDLDALKIGVDGAGKKIVWITARQHPGETMAEWFVEGLIEALVDDCNAVGRALLGKAVFYIVPNMNPDGSVRGNLRTNAAGANLNREWQNPSLARSPEVYLVRQQMLHSGVDAFLDVHGDESIPHNFVAGCEDNPSFSARQQGLQDAFKAAWLAASPDFQTKHGYGASQFGPETLTLATNWVGDAFGCLAYTIEMPFKDTADAPLPAVGWNGERSRQFGASVLQALLAVVDELK